VSNCVVRGLVVRVTAVVVVPVVAAVLVTVILKELGACLFASSIKLSATSAFS
jgi:hypothetical protein